MGAWVDRSNIKDRRSSGYGSIGAGFNLTNSWIGFSSFHGIGLITQTDTYLGSYFEFFHDFCLSIIDEGKAFRVGACLKHISNADLSKRNSGRDFIGLQFSFLL